MAFTFFFRDRFIIEGLCKQLVSKLQAGNTVKVWDAGCALGQEPYTFAIILAEMVGQELFRKVKIVATDIDTSDTFAPVVRNGIYRAFDLSRIPDEILKKYFIKIGDNNEYQLIEWVHRSLVFHKHDLLSLTPIDVNFDAIICKNVLLHLLYEERVEVIKMFHKNLLNNGFFIMEQTQNLPTECSHLFDKFATDTPLYQKK